jgi:hypothetical protein
VRDAKPILRRHLIAFLLDLYMAHGPLQFRGMPAGPVMLLATSRRPFRLGAPRAHWAG